MIEKEESKVTYDWRKVYTSVSILLFCLGGLLMMVFASSGDTNVAILSGLEFLGSIAMAVLSSAFKE